MDNNHIENAKYSITISRIHLSCLWDQLRFPQPVSQDLEVEHGQDENNTSSVSVSAHGASETRSLHSKICCNGDKTCQVSYTPGSALIHPLILSLASRARVFISSSFQQGGTNQPPTLAASTPGFPGFNPAASPIAASIFIPHWVHLCPSRRSSTWTHQWPFWATPIVPPSFPSQPNHLLVTVRAEIRLTPNHQALCSVTLISSTTSEIHFHIFKSSCANSIIQQAFNETYI